MSLINRRSVLSILASAAAFLSPLRSQPIAAAPIYLEVSPGVKVWGEWTALEIAEIGRKESPRLFQQFGRRIAFSETVAEGTVLLLCRDDVDGDTLIVGAALTEWSPKTYGSTSISESVGRSMSNGSFDPHFLTKWSRRDEVRAEIERRDETARVLRMQERRVAHPSAAA